jgi:hypothetical protein
MLHNLPTDYSDDSYKHPPGHNKNAATQILFTNLRRWRRQTTARGAHGGLQVAAVINNSETLELSEQESETAHGMSWVWGARRGDAHEQNSDVV